MGAVGSGRKPKLAVWKLASCDGCQLSLLDLEEHLLEIAGQVEIAYFLEASRATVRGPYDLSLVEGSISTPHEERLIRRVRRQSKVLVAIGACATAGGIQALRNFADVREFVRLVYAHPEYIRTLERVKPVAEVVEVDFELRGCPISRWQLLELLSAYLNGRRPQVPRYDVCVECKRRGVVCLLVSAGVPCLGPVTQAGCGALCPTYRRGCYGCYGPSDSPNPLSLGRRLEALGLSDEDIVRLYRTFNAWAPAFREGSDEYDGAKSAFYSHDSGGLSGPR